MRLNNVTVQSAQNAPLVLPRACGCEVSSAEPAPVSQPAAEAPCNTCGGNLQRAAEATASERKPKRKLQDFLGAFV